MGTVAHAVRAVYTDHRFAFFIIPKNRSNDARIYAVPATDTQRFVKLYTAAYAQLESIDGAGSKAGRVFTCSAHDYRKPVLHPTRGTNPDPGIRKPRLPKPPGAGKHAALAADAELGIDDFQSHMTHCSEEHIEKSIPFAPEQKPLVAYSSSGGDKWRRRIGDAKQRQGSLGK